MVHHRRRVVLADDTARLLLDVQRREPRLVDVLCRHVTQLRQVVPDEVAVLVVLLPEAHRAVHAEVLVEEARAREPHPVAVVERPVGVHEVAVEHRRAGFPVHEQVAPRQEARHRVARQVVHPALLLQLRHARVDPGETGSALFPRREALGVPGPRDLPADAVALHLVVVGRPRRRQVVELPPQELPLQALGGLGVLPV